MMILAILSVTVLAHFLTSPATRLMKKLAGRIWQSVTILIVGLAFWPFFFIFKVYGPDVGLWTGVAYGLLFLTGANAVLMSFVEERAAAYLPQEVGGTESPRVPESTD